MKFKIKDENGKEFEVEEVAEQDEGCGSEPEDVHDDESATLTPEEIASLKELAAIAPELKKLLEKKEEATSSEGEQHDEETEALDEDETEKAKEEVIDTEPEEPGKVKDSISRAAGKVERKVITDSRMMNESLEVEDAWTKRFNGGTK